MNVRSLFTTIGTILVLLTAGSLVIGGILGTPVGLAYVETGSMQPTLAPGDGFVAVPTQLAGDVEVGDVVTFQSVETNEGRLTTHRVVGRTENGFITRGDANPFTDQQGGEPPVKHTQIVAVALTMNDNIVVIPHLGDIVTGTRDGLASIQRQLAIILGTRALLDLQGLGYLLFAGSVLFYFVDVYLSSGGRDRTLTRRRDTGLDTRLAVGVMAAAVVFAATAAMTLPADPQAIQFTSVEDTTWSSGIEAGSLTTLNYTLSNSGFVPVFTMFELDTQYATVSPQQIYIPARGQTNATITVTAPSDPGQYRAYIIQHRYLAILPQSTISTLYHIHSWAPIVVIDALIGIPFYIFGTALVGSGRIRDRSRSRDLPHLARLRQIFRDLY